MTYQETLQYLYNRLPMFSRIGAAAYKADLNNTIALCNAIGNPQNDLKFIHVAGTNGKGSVSHSLAAILQTAGYRTGLYTSPHLHDFRERIRINNEMVSEQFVVRFTEQTMSLMESIQPSFFELTVAMAFAWFKEQQADIVVLETGMGGRLDSTNVVLPEVSVITNIGFDHQLFLGDTLAAIAGEKAGIIKPHIPVVIGETHAETAGVFTEKAAEMNAPILFADQAFEIMAVQQSTRTLKVAVQHEDENTIYTLDLNGWYQQKNLLTILATVKVLQQKGWQISRTQMADALTRVQSLTGLMGRWQILSEKPLIVADVAHNADGIKALLEQLKNTHFHRLHIIIGMVKDKDIDQVLSLLPRQAQYYFTQAHIERALPATNLQRKALSMQLNGEAYSNVNEAIYAAKSKASADDLILICGSIFLVAEIS